VTVLTFVVFSAVPNPYAGANWVVLAVGEYSPGPGEVMGLLKSDREAVPIEC
jgi:hypothetical protein